MTNSLYADAVNAMRPAVSHARTPDSERRYAVTIDGVTRYTDSAANVARWTHGRRVGTVEDRHAAGIDPERDL